MSSQGTWGYDSAGGDTAIQPPVRPERPERSAGSTRPASSAREADEFGGLRFGACFFGYLVAAAMLVVLTTAVSVVGLLSLDGGLTLTGLAAAGPALASPAAIALALSVVFLAYLSGGYVAGRMARFSGLAQGFGVWLWAVIVAVLTVVVALFLASQLAPDLGLGGAAPAGLPTPQLNLQALVSLAVVALVSLVGALLGGLLGMPYHRRIDRANLAR